MKNILSATVAAVIALGTLAQATTSVSAAEAYSQAFSTSAVHQSLVKTNDVVTLEDQIDPTSEINIPVEQQQKMDQALAVIAEKYGKTTPTLDENGQVVITPEDEARAEQAVNEYLSMIGFSDMMLMQRGLGKHWWNSTGTISKVIDVALIAAGIGAAFSSAAAARAALKAAKGVITRVVKSALKKAAGSAVAASINGAINIALTVSGASIGGLIAEGLDRLDGRNDGYIFA